MLIPVRLFFIFQTNHLVYWHYPPIEEDSDLYPSKIAALSHGGDVTELKVC